MHSHERWISLLLVLLASLIVVKVKFGLAVLNPFHAHWLLTSCSDYSDHYLAWEYFRTSPFTFPVGTIFNYPYPLISNIGFADGIPVFAFIFKPISWLFEGDFQYFGWWYLICFFLQGVCAGGMLRSLGIANSWLTLLGALFFVGSPVLLFRTPHPGLCAHWMILACFWVYFDSKMSPYAKDLSLTGLVALSIMSHPYLMPMIYALAIAYWIKQSFFENEKLWKPFLLKAFTAGAVILLVMWIIGLFSVSRENIGMEGFGRYSANMNTLFNPQGESNFLPALPTATDGQKAGFAYLGISIIGLLAAYFADKIRLRSFKIIPRSWLPLVIMTGLLALYSLSASWSVNEFVFLKFTLPEFITKPFRVSGRYIWPMHYLIMTGTLLWWAKQKALNDKAKIMVLGLLLLLQITDTSKLFKDKYIKHEYHPPFTSDIWEKVFTIPQKILMYPPYQLTYKRGCDRMHFVYFAQKNKKPINTGRIVYKDEEQRKAFQQLMDSSLKNGTIETFNQDVFVTVSEHLDKFRLLLDHGKIKGVRANDYIVFFPIPLIEENQSLQSLHFEDFK